MSHVSQLPLQKSYAHNPGGTCRGLSQEKAEFADQENPETMFLPQVDPEIKESASRNIQPGISAGELVSKLDDIESPAGANPGEQKLRIVLIGPPGAGNSAQLSSAFTVHVLTSHKEREHNHLISRMSIVSLILQLEICFVLKLLKRLHWEKRQ